MSAEIRWVGIGEQWEKDGWGNPYVGLRPSLGDLLEQANELLKDEEEIEHSFYDCRIPRLTKLIEFVDLLKSKGVVEDKNTKEQAATELMNELEHMINRVAGLSMALGRDRMQMLDYVQALETLKRHRGF